MNTLGLRVVDEMIGRGVAELIDDVYAVIEQPTAWTMMGPAWDRDGRFLDSPEQVRSVGVRFSVIGAVEKGVELPEHQSLVLKVIQEANRRVGCVGERSHLNRISSHQRVLNALCVAKRLACEDEMWSVYSLDEIPDRELMPIEYQTLYEHWTALDEFGPLWQIWTHGTLDMPDATTPSLRKLTLEHKATIAARLMAQGLSWSREPRAVSASDLAGA